MSLERIREIQIEMELDIQKDFRAQRDPRRNLSGKSNTGAALGFKRSGKGGKKL